MSDWTYSLISAEFARQGYSDNARIGQAELNRIMDKMCMAQSGTKFDADIAQQLYEQSKPDSDGKILVREYIDTILLAHKILREKITQYKAKLNDKSLDSQARLDAQENYTQFTNDYQTLCLPFAQAVMQQSMESSVANSPFMNRSSGIFDRQPSQRENSTSLKLTILLSMCALVLELMLAFQKNHFYGILVNLGVQAIVLMGFFDKYYMRCLLVNLLLAAILDFVWLFAHADDYWNPLAPTQYSTLQTTFLRFVYFFVIILIIVKVLLIIALFRYHNNGQTVRKSVILFGTTFTMDGKLKTTSPVFRPGVLPDAVIQ